MFYEKINIKLRKSALILTISFQMRYSHLKQAIYYSTQIHCQNSNRYASLMGSACAGVKGLQKADPDGRGRRGCSLRKHSCSLCVRAEEFRLLLQQYERMAHHGTGFVEQVQVEDAIAHVRLGFLRADKMCADALCKFAR